MSQHEFRAEIKQLLSIITHSIYTNREIFLRELLSNASDALDKLRFEQSRGASATDPELPLEIRLRSDKEGRRLTLTDTGVGMTEAECVEYIGTIAHSGSAAFLKNLTEKGGAADSIIGRFGVGFYSVFMVAEEVVLTTRSHEPGAAPARWTSDGSGTYEIGPGPEDAPRGTTIEIRLKEDAADFADPERVKAIIRKHSNFLSFPIYVDDEKVNTIPALWRESKFSVTPEQYKEFYEFLTFDGEEPLETIHVSVDAPVQFNALLFIPKRGDPFVGLKEHHAGLDLYARRVLITAANKDLIPEYLGFVRGVVDTEDLPLNISRETLQENVVLRKIKATLTKQVLERLSKLAKEDPERYLEFYKEHAKIFKLGYGDYGNREAFAELARFDSSALEAGSGALTGLAGYQERLKSDQKDVFYLSGPSRAALDMDPHLEIFRDKGLEVLYLLDPVDEFIMDAIREYKGLKLTSAELANMDTLAAFPSITGQEAGEAEKAEKSAGLAGLVAAAKAILGDRVTEVRVSTRLRQSPSCLVSPDGQMTSGMEKILKMVGKDASIPQKALELNPDHALVKNLSAIQASAPDDPFLRAAVEQLYESALLLDGYLSDPHKMVARVGEILQSASSWHQAVKKD